MTAIHGLRDPQTDRICAQCGHTKRAAFFPAAQVDWRAPVCIRCAGTPRCAGISHDGARCRMLGRLGGFCRLHYQEGR